MSADTSALLWKFVALRERGDDPTCWAWVDSKDATCGRAVGDVPHLCPRHATVARRKADAAVAKAQGKALAQTRADAEALPKWRAELERLERRYEARTPILDGPYGNRRAKNALDSRMAELVGMLEQMDRLRARIAVAESRQP